MNRITRGCEICGSPATTLLYRQSFARLSGGLLEGYAVVACDSCGFCFADDLPPQKAFDEYYRQMSKYEHEECNGGPSEYDSRRFPVNAAIIAEIVPNRRARVLEIGCATGGQLHELKKLGYESLLGVEASPLCRETAMRLYGIEVLPGSLSSLPEGIGHFDLVILGSVLEHVLELRKALRAISGALAPAGRLYVEVPDASRFIDAPDAPFQEFSVEHVNYFTPASLRNLLAAAGFREVHSQQTSIAQNESKMIFEIKAAFEMAEAQPRAVVPDCEGKPALRRYIETSSAADEPVRRLLGRLAAEGRPILVWGVGTHTQRLLAGSDLKRVNIAAFVDSNPRYRGRRLEGIPVLGPDELGSRDEPILISSLTFQEEIANQIRNRLGLTNELIRLYPSPSSS